MIVVDRRPRRWLRALALLALMLGACGSISEVAPLVVDADAGAAGDASPALDAPASDSSAENPTDAGAAEVAPEVPPDVPPACLSRDAVGFALNAPCAAGGACYGACALEGGPYVGCVDGFTRPTTCAPSCAACPGG